MEIKVELKFVLEENGGQFVMIHGTIEMLKSFADNLDLGHLVS